MCTFVNLKCLLNSVENVAVWGLPPKYNDPGGRGNRRVCEPFVWAEGISTNVRREAIFRVVKFLQKYYLECDFKLSKNTTTKRKYYSLLQRI